jgi:hypothetical protein
MATGPFSLRPGDTARTVVGLIMANTPTGSDATGATGDIVELVKRDKFAQRVYDDNFRTPTPPEPAKVNWRPLNNAVIVQWDSTSEYSYDDLERGLDFMGYIVLVEQIWTHSISILVEALQEVLLAGSK